MALTVTNTKTLRYMSEKATSIEDNILLVAHGVVTKDGTATSAKVKVNGFNTVLHLTATGIDNAVAGVVYSPTILTATADGTGSDAHIKAGDKYIVLGFTAGTTAHKFSYSIVGTN